MTVALPVFRIVPTAQTYDWGKIGLTSKVAQFAVASEVPGFTLDTKAPYAELWMGTHPKSPSRVLASNQILSEHLAAHPYLIGDRVIRHFDASGGNLPFLFKVLAIEKALSIQSHPDKQTAEKLHAEQPDIYKDPNHKPEMALALTPFSALCGFLPLPQIAAYLASTPEFAALIPSAIADRFLSIAHSSTPTGPVEKTALKDVFSALMTAGTPQVEDGLRTLVQRYKKGHKKDEKEIAALVLRLNDQFPGDIGIFCSFMLNYIQLQPGEAVFLGAGEPHAYVSGDIIECMANSDNVIRAGLTPKLRDIPNLVSGLTYKASPPTNHVVSPGVFLYKDTACKGSMLYDPPIPEFSVLQMKVQGGETETHPGLDGPSIAIVTEGRGKVEWDSGNHQMEISEGYVFFIGAGTTVAILSAGGVEECLTVYRAYVEVV